MHRALVSRLAVLAFAASTLAFAPVAPARAGTPLDPTGLPIFTPSTGDPLLPLAAIAPPSIATGADGTWYPVPLAPPPNTDVGARQQQTVIFDPVRQRFLLFGGTAVGASAMNDVWERPVGSANFWTFLTTSGSSPGPRFSHSAVYDPIGDRMIVFGGQNGFVAFNDVWELTLSGTPHWNQLQPIVPSPARFGHTAVIDAARDRMIVFAGRDTVDHNDTWFLDLTTSPPTWQLATTAGGPPGARQGHVAVFDSVHDRMVVYGGDFADTWTLSSFSGTPTWGRQGVTSPAGNRFGAGAGVDPAGDRMIVYGGILGSSGQTDIWALDLGGYGWSPLSAGTSPLPREMMGFAIDPVSRTAILQGGNLNSQTLSDTWSLDLPSIVWTSLVPNQPSPPPPPSLRYGAAGFFDAARNRFLMTGGAYVPNNVLTIFGDLLELQFGRDSEWVEVLPGAPFGRRVAHTATYDPVRDRILIFGGYNGAMLNDLWEIRLSPSPVVNKLNPAGPPPAPRDYQTVIYDPVRDRLILFDGNQPNGAPFDDLWQLTNLSSTPVWSHLAAAGTRPSPRWLHRAVYDPYADRMLTFGGYDGAGSVNDLWALSLSGTPTWTPLTPAGTPPGPRYGHSMELDPNRQRVIVYGGRDQANGLDLGDTWELRIGGQPLAWQSLAPAGTIPPPRYVHYGAYDAVHDRMFVSGGADIRAIRSDKWRLQFASDLPTATEMALLASDARADGVDLKWALSGDAATYARLERRDVSSDWRTLQSTSVSGSSVSFHDPDVVPGGRYAYRLTAIAGTQVSTSAEVWIDVPAGATLALKGFAPNPATREARVSFSLADRTAATIEVVDVGGRKLASRRIDAPTPGAQTIAIAPAGGLAPGLYFVRLTQGAHVLTARGSVMR